MIYHILDNNYRSLTVIDTEADEGISIENDVHSISLVNSTKLNTLTMDINKSTGPKLDELDPTSLYETSLIKQGCFIVFKDDNKNILCLKIREIEREDENIRTISAVDIGLELRNGSATKFESKNKQPINYYVERELYDTGWSIGYNELGNSVTRLVDCSEEETPLARIQRICTEFNCEATFTVKFQNLRIIKKEVNFYRSLGIDKSDQVLYSGVDIITMSKSINIDNVITAIEDTNNGFNELYTSDSRFFTRKGESIVYDRQSNAEYGRGNTFGERYTGWIIGRYESTQERPIDNYNEMKAILEERSEPTFSAEVDMLFNDGDFEIGDWLTFVDEEYNPPLRLKARVLEKEIHRSNSAENKAVIGNYQLLESLISRDLLAKQKEMQERKSSYILKLIPDNGTSFIEGESKTTTIHATVYKDGIDVTSKINVNDIMWFKVDKNGVHDQEWESKNKNSGTSVIIESTRVTDVASIRCVLTLFDNQFVQAIYFLNGLKNVARKVLRLQSKDTITSIHISDTHYATESITRDDLENYSRSNTHLKNAVELTHFIDTDFMVINGDVHDGTASSKAIATKNYKEMMDILSLANCPYFSTYGNHDDNSSGDARTASVLKVPRSYKLRDKTTKVYHGQQKQALSPKEMYEISVRPSTIFGIKENPDDRNGYFYYDIPEKKVRVIVLNTQDIPFGLDLDGYSKYLGVSVTGYRQKQITWLYNTLKSTPSEMTVQVYEHMPYGERYSKGKNLLNGQTLNYELGSYPYNYELISGIFSAFVTGGTFNKTYNDNTDFQASISCDFQGRKGKLAFLAHGHTHDDRLVLNDDGIISYSIGCSVSRPKKDQQDRPLGALEEDLWDVIVTDTKRKHVDLIRFGKGVDRSFDY